MVLCIVYKEELYIQTVKSRKMHIKGLSDVKNGRISVYGLKITTVLKVTVRLYYTVVLQINPYFTLR